MDELNNEVYEENNIENEVTDLVPCEDEIEVYSEEDSDSKSNHTGIAVAVGVGVGLLIKAGYDKLLAPKVKSAWGKHKEKKAQRKAEKEAEKEAKKQTGNDAAQDVEFTEVTDDAK